MNNKLLIPAAALLLASISVGQEAAEATSSSETPALRTVRPPVMPHAITSFGACRVGAWLYVFGGHIGRAHAHSKDNVIGAFRRLNMIDGSSWQELPPGPALQGTALVAAPDGTMYRVGGTDARNEPGADDDMHSTSSVQRFDPATGKWTEMTPLPEPRSSHDAIVCDNKLYVVGGWELDGDDGEWHETCWVADLASQPLTWQAMPPLDDVRRACAVATFDGKVAVLGGINGRKMISSIRVFDPEANAWSNGPDLPGAAFGTAALGVGEDLYATLMDGRVMKWDGAADSEWQPVAQLEMARFFHRMVPALDRGHILAFGGANMGGHMRTMEQVAITDGAAPALREYVIPAPSKVAYRQALLLQNDTIWALGGNRGNPGERFAPEQFATDVWKVDLTTMSAKKVGDLPEGCQSMASVTWGGRRENLVVGGLGPIDGAVKSRSGAFRWDMRRRQALPYDAALEAPRTQCQVVRYDDKVYVIGGIDFMPDGDGGSTKGDTREVLVFDPAADEPKFARAGIRLPRPRRSFGAAVIGSKLYLIGGLGEGFQHAGPCDVYDFESGTWTEQQAPAAWVSPQVTTIGETIYVACGGTMRGQRFTQDRSVAAFHEGQGWETVVAELPFPTRHVQMLTNGNRLVFYSVGNEQRDRIVIRTLEPDPAVLAPRPSFHR
ncbi:MAG: hypothetical protein VYA51_05275 [Planctomycetota bacterium]|nr:hypothetical protein [Planctomycetota bacterium]